MIKDNRAQKVGKVPEMNSPSRSDIITTSLYRSGVELDGEKVADLPSEFCDDSISRPAEDEVVSALGYLFSPSERYLTTDSFSDRHGRRDNPG